MQKLPFLAQNVHLTVDVQNCQRTRSSIKLAKLIIDEAIKEFLTSLVLLCFPGIPTLLLQSTLQPMGALFSSVAMTAAEGRVRSLWKRTLTQEIFQIAESNRQVQ